MKTLSRNLKTTLSGIVSTIALNILLLIGLVIPGLGRWAKRLFFLLCTYHELQRIRILTKIPLETINCKMLKIKEPVVLSGISEWSKSMYFNLDVDVLKRKGFDVTKLTQDSCLTAVELELLSEAIVTTAPSKLNYGRDAMYNDLQRLLQEKIYIVPER